MRIDYPFDEKKLISGKKKIKRELLESGTFSLEKRIAILGGSTTSEMRDMIEIFLLNEGIKPIFYESGYGLYYDEGAFENRELADFSPDIVYIHTSYRNLSYLPTPADSLNSVEEKIESEFKKYVNLWENISKKYNAVIIQNNFELPPFRLMGNADCVLPQGIMNYIMRINSKFSEYASNHSNFYIHDILYESADFGLQAWFDPFYWHMYKYAMSLKAIPYSAYGVFRIIKALYGKNKKALALDLDNTLWGGIIGDDGAEGIEIGKDTPMAQTYSEFQEYVKKLSQIGVILCVDSKNDESVALKGFERPDSVLKREDFAVFKANWEPKDLNLVETAKELNILPESFVFFDDNPSERAIVKGNVQGVSVPEVTTPEEYLSILDHAGYFETLSLSEDDLARNAMYAANASRNSSIKDYSTYEEYLKSLEMHAEIAPFSPMYMSRIAQLIGKTNQFNLTTKRFTQAEIEAMAASDEYITLYGKLSDKFGDNGVISVVIGHRESDSLHILLWLMSCRVFKRGMEYAMFDKLLETSKDLGIKKIVGYYYPTEKNKLVKEFYGEVGFSPDSEDTDGNGVWFFDTSCDHVSKNTNIEVN